MAISHPGILNELHDQILALFDLAIDVFTKVEKYYFSTRYFHEKKLDRILQQIECEDSSLQVLYFGRYFKNWCSKTETGLTKLFRSLRYNTSLRTIYLYENNINDRSVSVLADSLPTTAIHVVRLNSNSIGCRGSIAIGNALSSSTITIQELNLRHNFICDAGASVIAEGLRENTSLLKLSIENNKIGDQGAIAIAKALYKNTTLQSLLLGFNKGIGDQSAFEFSKMLANGNVTLQHLSFHGCNIGNQGAAALGEGLSINKTLLDLLLQSNVVDDEGAILFTKSLKSNRTLRKIAFYGNKVKRDGLQELLKAKFYHLTPTAMLKGWPLSPENWGSTHYSWRALAGIKDKHKRYPMHIAASKNYKWENGLKDIVEANYAPLIESDYPTGLYPFMLAAIGKNADLEAIYRLLRLNPEPMHISV